MRTINTIESKFLAQDFKFAIVASRVNNFVVKSLLGGAVDQLKQHDVNCENITIVKVPGSFEMPLAVKQLAQSKKYAGIICIGAIIKGDTYHFELIANETTKGLAQLMLEYELPITLGLITAYNTEQAIARAGTKAGNQGSEAAKACLEMVNLMKAL
jgi:6,7-dimethyl-8-ribityllumazine synthase